MNKHHEYANPDEDNGDKESRTRRVWVEPRVKVDLVPEFTKETESASATEDTYKKKNWIASSVTAAATALAFFAMAIQGYFIYRSNQTNREALTSVQRAFIACQDVSPSRFGQMEEKARKETWLFTTPCENTGTTPGNVIAQAFWGSAGTHEPTEEEFLRLPPLVQPSVVGPKSVHNVGNMVISEEEIFGRILIENITKERPSTDEHATPFVFWGWLAYRDVFPNTKLHVTEFCKRSVTIRINTNDPQKPYEWGWMECEQHNCADEYCEDYASIVKLAKK